MSDQTKAKAIDGQKKFTATLTGFVMSFLNGLVTTGVMTEEAASPLIQVLAIGLPIVGAFAYDLIQGSHDKKKEEVRKVEVEQRFLIEKKPAEAPPPGPKPKAINFKEFTNEVLEGVEKDDKGQPKGISLYYAVLSTGRRWELEVLTDLRTYAELVLDAAQHKFEDIHGFTTDDPDLAKILKTVGKCPYSSLEAYCSYEGNQVALIDVENAYRERQAVWDLIALDSGGSWRTAYDTSLFGVYGLAEHIVSILRQQGR